MSKGQQASGTATGAVLVALAAADGGVPEWVKLLPVGNLNARDGRRWRLPKTALASVVAASLALVAAGVDPVFDYDHQTDLAAVRGVGGRAPASGWIKELQARDDGIYARVEWTPAAQAALQAKEYRYVSPVFDFDDTGLITAVRRASLTNKPALDLPALAAEAKHGDVMDWTKLAQALGLGADATEEQILAAIAELKSAKDGTTALASAVSATALALGLAADAAVDAVTAEAKKLKAASVGDGTALAAVQTELNELKAGFALRDATAKVDAAVKAGKIVPAARDSFLALAQENPARFDAIVGAQPAVVTPGIVEKDIPDNVALTAEEKSVAVAMGLDEAAMLETKKKELA